MALERLDRIVLGIYSVVAVVAIIFGALSSGRIVTFQTGTPLECADGTFSVDFPFLIPLFPGICSSVENAIIMLELAVLSVGINGILWPIYYYFYLSGDVRWDNPRTLLFGNDQPDADFLLRIISIVGSSVYITLFYQLELGDANGKFSPGEDRTDSAASIERVVNAFSAVAIIGGGIQLAFFLFWKKVGLVTSDGNMDDGIDYIQM